MKNRIIISTICVFNSVFCVAQEAVIKNKVDSLSLVSRSKADLILSHFDSPGRKKLLYSISDEQYYLILQDSCCYKEYYIYSDSSGNTRAERSLKTAKRDIKLLTKAFELRAYHRDFVTRVDDPTVVQGNPSYFVIKDANGERYGEYWLSVITVPVPIDQQLFNYLFARLLRESTTYSNAAH